MQAGQDGRYVAVERIAYADTAAPICHIWLVGDLTVRICTQRGAETSSEFHSQSYTQLDEPVSAVLSQQPTSVAAAGPGP